MDWGYLRPGVFLWAVVLPDNRLYIEREFVFTETIAQDVAIYVKLMTSIWGWTLARSIGDPAMKIRQAGSGEDLFETLAKNGLYVQPGNNERVLGWNRLRAWLKVLPDGLPGLIISPSGCPYLCRTLPELMQDKHKLEDVNTNGEDHAADALRYLVMDRPHPMESLLDKPVKPGTAGELFHKLLYTSTAQVLGSYNVSH